MVGELVVSITRSLMMISGRGARTFAAVVSEIALSTPRFGVGVEFSLHFVPGEHDGAGVAVDVFGGVARLLEVFDEVDGEMAEEGKVETIQPYHRFLWEDTRQLCWSSNSKLRRNVARGKLSLGPWRRQIVCVGPGISQGSAMSRRDV